MTVLGAAIWFGFGVLFGILIVALVGVIHCAEF